MPTYDYKCPTCGRGREVLLRLAELDSAIVHCLNCEGVMNRQISAPRIFADYPGYSCPVTGKWIEGRRAHIENLARTGCRLLEPGEKEEHVSRKRREEAELEAKLDATIEQTIHEMPVQKREQLASELQAGVTAEAVRA